DSRAVVRLRAAQILGEFRGLAKEAVKPLGKALEDDKLDVRVAAAGALWKIDGQSRPGVAVLTDALRKGNLGVRRAAPFQLAEMGPAAKEAGKALDEAANDDDLQLAVNSAVALWKTDRQARVAVLIKGVDKRDFFLASAALKVLAEMGEKAEPAIPAIVG